VEIGKPRSGTTGELDNHPPLGVADTTPPTIDNVQMNCVPLDFGEIDEGRLACAGANGRLTPGALNDSSEAFRRARQISRFEIERGRRAHKRASAGVVDSESRCAMGMSEATGSP
jgi:hypothetical protein